MSANVQAIQLSQPRFEQRGTMLIAGLGLSLTDSFGHDIPDLWQKLAVHLGQVPQQIGTAAYGLCIQTGEDNTRFDYLAGMEVTSTSGLPADWTSVTIPAQNYAVFVHAEHVSKVAQTIHAIFDQWLPGSGHKPALAGINSLHFFERYGAGFDPQTGLGDIEIWLPIKA